MSFEGADAELPFRESEATACFFPPSSPRPVASALPNPTPATKYGCGAGVGKAEGGKKREERGLEGRRVGEEDGVGKRSEGGQEEGVVGEIRDGVGGKSA
jgi:hypothetical protein